MATLVKRGALRQKKRPSHKPLTNSLRQFRLRCQISQSLLARLLDVSLRTISGLEAIPGSISYPRRAATQTIRLCDALAETMDARHIGQWLDEPNDMLAGLKPVEAIERGQLDLVWQVVEGLRSGSQL